MTLPLPALLILQRGFVGLDLTTVKKSAQVKILDICMSIKFNTLAFYMSLFYYMSLYYYMSLFYYIIYNVKLTGSQRIRHNWAHTHTHSSWDFKSSIYKSWNAFCLPFLPLWIQGESWLSKMNGWMCSWVRKPINPKLRLYWGTTSQKVFMSLWNSVDLTPPTPIKGIINTF